MSTQCKFDVLETKDVEVRFDGGQISTDAGLSVFIEWMHKDGFIDPYADILEQRDPRVAEKVTHAREDLLRQRVLQVIAGYEDANDSDELRKAPLFCAANGRVGEHEANASQPTISRLENNVEARDVVKLNRMLLEDYIASRTTTPEEIILEMDATAAATHGNQQRALFHGYHGQNQYHPLVIADGDTGELLSVRLRHGTAPDHHRACGHLKRVVRRLKEAFPGVLLRFRADSGFSGARLMQLLDDADVRWVVNFAMNSVLKEQTQRLREQAREDYDQTGEPVVRYVLLEDYQANTWDRPRYVVAKIEANAKGTNRRFVVCSDRPESPRKAYGFYAGRGVCEQYIKEFKGGYRGDKLSCHRFVANAFRLVMVGMAYTAIARFRARHLRGTALEGAWIETIRRKLFKLGARIEVSVRRFWIHASEEWPYQDLFRRVAESVCPQPG